MGSTGSPARNARRTMGRTILRTVPRTASRSLRTAHGKLPAICLILACAVSATAQQKPDQPPRPTVHGVRRHRLGRRQRHRSERPSPARSRGRRFHPVGGRPSAQDRLGPVHLGDRAGDAGRTGAGTLHVQRHRHERPSHRHRRRSRQHRPAAVEGRLRRRSALRRSARAGRSGRALLDPVGPRGGLHHRPRCRRLRAAAHRRAGESGAGQQEHRRGRSARLRARQSHRHGDRLRTRVRLDAGARRRRVGAPALHQAGPRGRRHRRRLRQGARTEHHRRAARDPRAVRIRRHAEDGGPHLGGTGDRRRTIRRDRPRPRRWPRRTPRSMPSSRSRPTRTRPSSARRRIVRAIAPCTKTG